MRVQVYITQHCPIEIVRHVGNDRLDRQRAGKTELGTGFPALSKTDLPHQAISTIVQYGLVKAHIVVN